MKASPAPRQDIQALRALAVLLVLGYHLWPGQLTGGFVGVDIFFVISGYLITKHLYKELELKKRIRFKVFWSRRIRRLLPLAFTVIGITLIATLVFLPQVYWSRAAEESIASAGYFQNWLLLLNSIDYFAAENAPWALQHYWSLSIEEQFYILWPVLLGLIFWFASKNRWNPRKALSTSVLIVLVSSYTYSVILTSYAPQEAYLNTMSRMWELAMGGLLVFAEQRFSTFSVKTRIILFWAGGLTAILSAMLLTSDSVFPGWIALLPTAGAALVILAEQPRSRWIPHVLINNFIVQRLGDYSYGIYLWHWPLIIIIPIISGHSLTLWEKFAILFASIALSAGSKYLIEDPLRSSEGAIGSVKRSFGFMVAGLVSFILAACAIVIPIQQAQNQIQDSINDGIIDVETGQGSCFGPLALIQKNNCLAVTGTALVTPPEFASQDLGIGLSRGECHQVASRSELLICDYGETENPTQTIALIGDSHARHWTDAVAAVAEQRGWKLLVMTMSSCPALPLTDQAVAEMPNCAIWGQKALDVVSKNSNISAVYFANYADFAPLNIAATEEIFRELQAAGKQVFLIKDNPNRAGLGPAPECVANATTYTDCVTLRSDSLKYDDFDFFASNNAEIGLIDLSDYFCDAELCYSVIGGVIVFHDHHHLTGTYSRLLAPFMGAQIDDLIKSSSP